ncbi:MAG: hypothetical protein QOG63_2410 [Thermoleophilaceae bacterium]|nr:hypothetical protein [Thermoleophilaceae bacterium]
MDIGQGAGVSGATGVRPFLPALLIGALARNDSGVDFDSTDYSFLESPTFLVIVLALAVLAYALNSGTADRGPRAAGLLEGATGAIGIALGALLFAGSLAADGQTSWWGIPAGILCAALGYFGVAALFGRARRRLANQPDTRAARSLIDLYAEGVALALAALALFVEPAGYAALVVFAFLIFRSRGERGQKYEGLRILR